MSVTPDAGAATAPGFRLLADASPDGIVCADAAGLVTYLNPAAERMFGWEAAEIRGRTLTVLMPPRFRKAHEAGFARHLATGDVVVIGRTVELAGLHREHGEFPIALSLCRWEDGGVAQFTAIVRDLTVRVMVVVSDGDEDSPPPTAGTGRSVPARYEDLGTIGVGGMGEVHRVRDRELGRTCAYKVLRAEHLARPALVARFVEEAQVGAQLQHPNIPPTYEGGRLPDGRPWFTLKEVHGLTLAEHILRAHAAELDEAALRRLVDPFASVCDAVGYAHGRGVVHRDLKPANVMSGAHGEVYVIDWGLAKLVGRDEPATEPVVVATRGVDGEHTRAGGVLGTVAYMPPEQARGEVARVGARADVYALGAILYEILSGRPPYEGRAALAQVLAGPPVPVTSPTAGAATFAFGDEAPAELRLPEDLVDLCERCMARDPEHRPPDGAAVAAEVRAWLDGARRRQRAHEIVSEATALVARAAAMKADAAHLRAAGETLLATLASHAPDSEKAPGWADIDRAEQVERDAARLELQREALLRGALTHAPDLADAHADLVVLELERHRMAEAERIAGAAAQAEIRLREHVEALAPGHPIRRAAASYLDGNGRLTLATEPPGAHVDLLRYEPRDRRLVAVPMGALGATPLSEVPLAMGSYLCVLSHPGCAAVHYPVSLGRAEHWDGRPPGAAEPLPIRLPTEGDLGEQDCLVPAGWFWAGGDPQAPEGGPRRRVWCDPFVVRRFPVTNREYVAFLDDLVARGEHEQAERCQPAERAAIGEGRPVYGRDAIGRFVLRADADGDLWQPDWPVFLVDWHGATAYASWLAERTGRPWRLVGELEREKAARGADGRFYPWGDFLDPSWCSVPGSRPGRPVPQAVDTFPVDASVYGVRGLGGNIEDWCADILVRDGPAAQGDVVAPPPAAEPLEAAARCARGGSWVGATRFARSAFRRSLDPGTRYEFLGFRLAFRPSW